jgi:lysozyme
VNEGLTYSKEGLALTERFEGCRLQAYQDVVGVWTIGYGHTHGVRAGLTCTQQEAEQWLEADVQWAVQAVRLLVKVSLGQGEFDAFVDFVFNAGSGNFANSSMLRDLNAGDFGTAAEQFALWDHAGGQVVAGLLRRRQAEASEFTGGAV